MTTKSKTVYIGMNAEGYFGWTSRRGSLFEPATKHCLLAVYKGWPVGNYIIAWKNATDRPMTPKLREAVCALDYGRGTATHVVYVVRAAKTLGLKVVILPFIDWVLPL